MSIWRNLADRLGSARFTAKPLRVVVLFAALLLLVGCGGGLRHESWPGLIAVGDTLYVANLEHVQALSAETGKVYWSYPSEDERAARPFYSTPVLAEDVGENGVLLVAGFSDRTVYALALGASPAERPDELWRFAEAGGQYVGTGTVASGLFLIGNGDGKVYALNIEDGSKAWEFATDDRVWATPVVVDDTVYVASLDHTLYALELQTGTEQWRVDVDGSVAMTPVLAGRDLWFGDFSSKLYQVDTQSGTISWTFEAENWLWATPVLDGSVLYFADVGGKVYALDIERRELVWDAPVVVDDAVRGRPALNGDGSLLFVAGYEKGAVYAIDTTTGTLRQSWGSPLENPGRLPSDLVTGDQRLYTLPILVSARVQAFSLAAGELIWSSPQGD